jgi:hypothetical protein
MAVPSGVKGVIFHTMVGDLPGTDSVFLNPNFQASAHFGISQTGEIIQWVNIRGGVAWAEMAGNYSWFSCEMADHGNPNEPYTAAQITSAARLAELLSRVGNFPLVVTNSTGGEGLGTHNMGGGAWGGHSCPDLPPQHVRSSQRQAIINLAKEIRGGVVPVPDTDFDGPSLVAPGYYWWRVDAYAKNLSSFAQARNTTAEAIIAHTLSAGSPISGYNKLNFENYAKSNPKGNGRLPAGLVFYTVNP